MRVLLIGRGGREHALAWKLCQTAQHVFVVPGNGGTAAMAPNVSNVEHADMHDFQSLVALARTLAVDLVLPGPDDVVVEGIADVFEQAGIPCFAPSKAAAKLEGSKTFAKDFMRRYDIPTAEYRNFDTYEHARDYLSSINHRVVIKVSGLAAGKGVVLPETQGKAQRELREMMVDKKFGHQEVVIEEFLSGDEISILTFSDGHTFRSLPPVQDHKRIFNGSEGPNTGGMGVYGPVDFVSRELMAQMEKDIIVPTFQGLRSDDIQIFHAGTVRLGDELRTAGGRVFAVAAVRASLAEAVHAAYEGVSCIAFEGMQYRSDIASSKVKLPTSIEKTSIQIYDDIFIRQVHIVKMAEQAQPAASGKPSTPPLIHNAAIAGAVISPIIMLLPPRRVDWRFFLLTTTFSMSTSQLAYDWTGQSIYDRVGKRFERLTTNELPPAAQETQRRLREEKMRREGLTEQGLRQQELAKRNALQKLWYGNETEESWNKKRAEEHQTALEEGQGLSGIIMGQISEVVSGKSDDTKKDDEGKEA
ncbi:hypothetical protein BN1708_001319 [Verticillium longisporum]|uniref:phosphoribosylamine--glycine ligase n=2 Tax=Verticillium longisporum TaxID=100787 RepID=A0A0G4MNE6_VERLO|nr:hypothetical protein BN1708_001319 [Verticillium longisporum]